MKTPDPQVLVVGAVDYGEADRVVHVLSRLGRASLFAPSARKSRRRFAGALEPFTTISPELAPGQRRGLPTLASASVVKARPGIRTELERIALASYAVELASRVAPEGDAADGLYELTVAMLDRLSDARQPAAVTTRRVFELRLLDVLGYAPKLDACLEASCALAETSYLDLLRGGALCEQHRGQGRVVGPRTRAWLGVVLSDPATLPDERGGLPDEAAALAAQKLGPSTEAFFSHLLGRPLHSSALLATLSLC